MVQLGYLLALGSACLLSGWIGHKAWRNLETTGARPLVTIAAATFVWAGASLGLTLSTAPAAELRWLQASYLGMVAAPIAFFLLALEYTGRDEYLTVRVVGSLLALGSLFLTLVWTNPQHELYWAEINYGASVPEGIATTPASGFWAFVAFTYVLLLLGSLLLLRYALTAPNLYRGQTTAVLIGVAAPWTLNIPHAFQLMTIDLTPVALSVTTVALWTAMYHYRMGDIGPIALRTVFESISTGVYVLDAQNRIIDLNAAGKDMLNVPDDAIGAHIRHFAPNDAFFEQIQDATNQRNVVAVEDGHHTDQAAPTRRYYEVQGTPIQSSAQQRDGRIVVVTDVTDQRHQQKQLEEQNERLETFASVVSHDLRNPLNVAAGNLTLARETGNDEYLARADRALSRMETLIDDLLALAHGGIGALAPEPIELETVVHDAWSTTDTKDATLNNRTSLSIVADRSRLHQLIANLLRNAVEHGGESVTITIGDTETGFYVADDGPGIPSDKQERVFETGYSTRETGTGLGLNIVQKIADTHGWEVHVTEAAEGGASFKITNVEIAE